MVKGIFAYWTNITIPKERVVRLKEYASGNVHVMCSCTVSVHQVRDWNSAVAIKMDRRQGGPSQTGTGRSIQHHLCGEGARSNHPKNKNGAGREKE
jgi:hypothetical protein